MKSISPLQIVPAGAGSGKTYKIQHQIGDWIATGTVRPERVMAVTYTEAAAAELRERISARLLELGRIEDAIRLGRAYISTIHGFGLRVLTEFAFEVGVSPRPRLLAEFEESALVRQVLPLTRTVDAIQENLEAFGYTYSYPRRMTAEECFRDDLLEVLQQYRSIGLVDEDRSRALREAAEGTLVDRYGATGDPVTLALDLQNRAAALLKRYPKCMAAQVSRNKAAKRALEKDYRNLQEAAHGAALHHDWKLWQSLRDLRISNTRTALPSKYDNLAVKVMFAAGGLSIHPGPLQMGRDHLRGLLAGGYDILRHYEEAKRDSGVVDYTDMIAEAERLLRTRKDVLRTLADRIDCLVVDEFQDTNPIQFALVWTLHKAGVPTLVVGDLKQAIMGFQGADPRLFEALAKNSPDAVEPLDRNWRSQPDLMGILNDFGSVLFNDEYLPLKPQAQRGGLSPLEFVRFEKRPNRRMHAVRALAVGGRLKELLADDRQWVTDRGTGQRRGLRPSDIAVLCPTNGVLDQYAEALRILGLRVNRQEPGWLATRPVQLVWHALSYLVNRGDRHAALYLSVTELGSLSLEEGLRQLADEGRVEDAVLGRLDAIAEDIADRTVYALLADVLAALGLFDEVASWPDSEQHRANLVQLLAAAGEFMDSEPEGLAHCGFHGTGIQTFLAWLGERAAIDDRQAEKKVLEEDAIVLRTWHSSKGLEWPVVAVCGLDRDVRADLPHLDLNYRSFDNISHVLEEVYFRFLPRYGITEVDQRARLELQLEERKQVRRLLYVVLTRAREKLMLEWPAFLEKKQGRAAEALYDVERNPRRLDEAARLVGDAKSYWSLLRGACSLDSRAGKFQIGNRWSRCRITEGDWTWPDDLPSSAGLSTRPCRPRDAARSARERCQTG